MTEEQFRALRTLILDQNVKIEALSAEVRRLRQVIENAEPVVIDGNRISSDDLQEFLRTRQPHEPHSDN